MDVTHDVIPLAAMRFTVAASLLLMFLMAWTFMRAMTYEGRVMLFPVASESSGVFSLSSMCRVACHLSKLELSHNVTVTSTYMGLHDHVAAVVSHLLPGCARVCSCVHVW